MADKRVKSFSPYNYGIKYRVPGKNPYQKYQYVPGAGGIGTEPVYVVSTTDSIFFPTITNYWYFGINENDEICFLKCDSDVFIFKEKIDDYFSITNLNIKRESTKIIIKKNSSGKNYNWINESIVQVYYTYNVISDIVVFVDNEYYNENCNIIMNENKTFNIEFKDNIDEDAEIIVLIYPVQDLNNFINDSYNFKTIKNIEKIYYNDNILIKNELGNIDYRYIILNSNNQIYNLTSFNVEPSYIEFEKNDVKNENEEDISKIYAYSPNDFIETFIVQYGIDEENIKWDINRTDASVIITHNLNGYVNYILDRNDYRKIIKKIRKMDNNQIQIEFDKNKYIPNVLSLVLFKIGEE